MINLKSEKGSITVFVLASCMFFIAAVTCMQMYMQSKQIAVDREYRQIKANYEKDIENIENIYDKKQQENNLEVTFSGASADESTKKISLNATLNTQNLEIKKLKYGWYYSDELEQEPSSNNISNWTYVENVNGDNHIPLNKTYTDEQKNGYHYLCFVVNNKEYWKKYKTMGLPNEYQRVEYIESTGTQYIDTGVIPDDNTGFYLDFILLDSINNNGKRLVGTSYRNDGAWGGIMLSSWNMFTGGQLCYLQRNASYNPCLVTNTRMELSLINRHYRTSTGANIEFQSSSLSDIYGSIYLLNVNTDVFNNNGSSAIIYSVKIYNGNSVIRNYVPCKRKSDNEPGLFDVVNNEFYTNQGTGKFLKGEDVIAIEEVE